MADTCVNCNAVLSPSSTSCPSCGSPRRTPSTSGGGGGFCGSCGTALASKFAPCPKCGHVKTTFNPQVPPQGFLYKSPGTTNLLSILCSLLLATNGVGHLYLGQIGKGIGLMIGGWALIAGVFLGMILVFPAVICGIGALILWIWSMIDANKQVKIYNEFVAQNGRAPW